MNNRDGFLAKSLTVKTKKIKTAAALSGIRKQQWYLSSCIIKYEQKNEIGVIVLQKRLNEG